MFLYPVKPPLCLRAVTPLPETQHVEASRFNEIAFRRMQFFLIKQRRLVVRVMITAIRENVQGKYRS
jgi:hypothetical protein